MGLSITPSAFVGLCALVATSSTSAQEVAEGSRRRKRYDQMRLAWNTSYILGSEADNPVEWRPGCPHRL